VRSPSPVRGRCLCVKLRSRCGESRRSAGPASEGGSERRARHPLRSAERGRTDRPGAPSSTHHAPRARPGPWVVVGIARAFAWLIAPVTEVAAGGSPNLSESAAVASIGEAARRGIPARTSARPHTARPIAPASSESISQPLRLDESIHLLHRVRVLLGQRPHLIEGQPDPCAMELLARKGRSSRPGPHLPAGHTTRPGVVVRML
jgi:hypothetical protein